MESANFHGHFFNQYLLYSQIDYKVRVELVQICQETQSTSNRICLRDQIQVSVYLHVCILQLSVAVYFQILPDPGTKTILMFLLLQPVRKAIKVLEGVYISGRDYIPLEI